MSRLTESLQGNRNIWAIYILLIVISIVAMFSASSQLISVSISRPIFKHVSALLGGFIMFMVTYKINQGAIRRIAFFGLSASVLFLCVLAAKMVLTASTAERSLSIGGYDFQPAEIARLTLFIYCADRIEMMHSSDNPKRIGIFLIVAIDLVVLLIAISNLSTAILVMLTCFVMMVIGNVNIKAMLINTIIIGAAGLMLLTFDRVIPDEGAMRDALRATPFRRVETWNNRIDRAISGNEVKDDTYIITDDNRQSSYSHIAIAKGGLAPHLPGSSTMRNHLANVYNDYIFALIVEEGGAIFALIVIGLYFWFAIVCCKIMYHAANIYQATLVGGIGFIILAQTLVHFFVCVSDFVTGQPLPLISQGRMSIWVTSIYFGLVLAASLRTERAKKSGLTLSDTITTEKSRRKQEKEFVATQNEEVSSENEEQTQPSEVVIEGENKTIVIPDEKIDNEDNQDDFDIEIVSNNNNDEE